MSSQYMDEEEFKQYDYKENELIVLFYERKAVNRIEDGDLFFSAEEERRKKKNNDFIHVH